MEQQFEITRDFIDDLIQVIESKDEARAVKMIEELHPADIADIYDELSIDQAKFLYLLLDSETAADVLIELEEDDRERFLKALPSDVIARQFISEMDSDDAADVMGDLSETKQEEILSHIDDLEQAGDIVDLLKYDEDSAGGLMAKEYVAVKESWSVEKCISEIRRQADEVEELFYVYVTDENNILKGLISLKDLLLNKPTFKISGLIDEDVISVKTEETAEEVANIMDKYDLVSLPVVDSIGRLCGRITIDDVVDVIRDEAEKDYQLSSGITSDVVSSDKVFQLTRARLPWLLIGLSGGVLGAQVISNYEVDLGIYPQMAFFIPLIAAMGGNVGIQSSAIVVQSLANNTLGLESTSRKLFKELLVGLMNGIICSTIIFLFNYLFSDSLALTISVASALFTIIVFASVFGTLVPLTLDRIKIDPALATGPFITTVNDIFGLIIYLTMGRAIFAALAGTI